MGNREKIVKYIKENGQATVQELALSLGISLSMTHRHLKTLVGSAILQKVGSAPRVFYIVNEGVDTHTGVVVMDDAIRQLINKNFLLITPQGQRVDGVDGFVRWCIERGYDTEEKAHEYEKLFYKYERIRKDGLFDGMLKFRNTFKEICVDGVYYIDFYAWEIFGKTQLGQLLLYAKQSEDREMMKNVVEIASPHIIRMIQKYRIEAIGYIPPTVKRSVQLMGVLEKSIQTNLSVIAIEKVPGEIRVPQKTLSKLKDRMDNARATIFVSDRRQFGTVLLIDDAVGSGATLNEVACKLRKQKVAKKVIGLAIVGSVKGFDVISEV